MVDKAENVGAILRLIYLFLSFSAWSSLHGEFVRLCCAYRPLHCNSLRIGEDVVACAAQRVPH
jgi:hypothetical protein